MGTLVGVAFLMACATGWPDGHSGFIVVLMLVLPSLGLLSIPQVVSCWSHVGRYC